MDWRISQEQTTGKYRQFWEDIESSAQLRLTNILKQAYL